MTFRFSCMPTGCIACLPHSVSDTNKPFCKFLFDFTRSYIVSQAYFDINYKLRHFFIEAYWHTLQYSMLNNIIVDEIG